MTRSQRRFSRVRFYPESSSIIFDKVDRSRLPDDVPRTWILTLRDRALSVASQRRSIAALGGVQTMYPVDTCHNLMVSEPRLLAEMLLERCRAASIDDRRRLVQAFVPFAVRVGIGCDAAADAEHR